MKSKKIISTTILGVRVGNKIALGGDGQVTMGDVKMTDISGKTVPLNDVKMENGLLVIFSCNKGF